MSVPFSLLRRRKEFIASVSRVSIVSVGKALVGGAVCAGVALALQVPAHNAVMGGYVTSLRGRTSGQRNNALLAAQRIDGVVIPSGETFSFNQRVGPWGADRGYVKALVSYDGELVTDWGGGVCQTSTTLYNTALLAGLTIVERHRHTWAPRYVPPGRDAAVAQRDLDLKIKNPYSWPVRLRMTGNDNRLGFEALGAVAGPMARVECNRDATSPPLEVTRRSDRLPWGQRRLVNRGKPGVRVTVYRRFLHDERMKRPDPDSLKVSSPASEREWVSQDAYPVMDRVVVLGSRRG